MYTYVNIPSVCNVLVGQKRASDLLELEIQMVVRLHVGNSYMGTLEEQPLLLTTEPALQP